MKLFPVYIQTKSGIYTDAFIGNSFDVLPVSKMGTHYVEINGDVHEQIVRPVTKKHLLDLIGTSKLYMKHETQLRDIFKNRPNCNEYIASQKKIDNYQSLIEKGTMYLEAYFTEETV